MMLSKKQSGFTLIELMIVIMIVGILASIASPAYSQYSKKAKFSEVVLAGSSVKNLIDLCFQIHGEYTLTNCDSMAKVGAVKANVIAGAQVADASITTTSAKIVITGHATKLDGKKYELTPTKNGNSLIWVAGGDCVAANLC